MRTVSQDYADFQRDLLLKSGTEAAAADKLLADLGKQYDAEVTARRDRKRELEWREPRSPELHKMVLLPFTGRVDPIEVQRFIALVGVGLFRCLGAPVRS